MENYKIIVLSCIYFVDLEIDLVFFRSTLLMPVFFTVFLVCEMGEGTSRSISVKNKLYSGATWLCSVLVFGTFYHGYNIRP